MDILLVDEGDVLALAGVPPEDLHKVLLNAAAFLFNAVISIRNAGSEKTLPLAIGESIAVQFLQLFAEVGNQLRLRVDRKILIALFSEQADKFLLQRGLALVAVGAGLDWLILRYHRVFGRLGDDVEIAHISFILLQL